MYDLTYSSAFVVYIFVDPSDSCKISWGIQRSTSACKITSNVLNLQNEKINSFYWTDILFIYQYYYYLTYIVEYLMVWFG